MDIKLAEQIVKIVNEDGGDAELYENYSGRGMYGKTTTGITGTTGREVYFAVINRTQTCELESDFPTSFRSDSMGLSTILY